ncbi:branched-chain amino acid transport system II carrier protein [Pontibacillus sp. ALD_SL1]|uniref:branched-chain amino acid transport system II carrier protein n=1 Tax=Pontibacillus sp. ALD_SL1 TaxID=2777185 RepID=UPI001A95D5CF|nr:branched-chain amino acid transport system II carrier protein [Pontibacillus sp. ALD_SL1]QSS99942.1 branched-chain amino acid transport system II carrier protein [Pontibacillus sp. ALD_SL1]
MTKKDTVTIGFMLFALFFGAGNLIYPPQLGTEAGSSYWSAIAGFIITGVGLPILAVTAIAFVNDDAKALGSRVHPWFGLLFTSLIYLAIGPFFAIPRAANVAFETGIKPVIGSAGQGSSALLIFSIIFFALVFWISLNPSKIVDRIGQWLTPILLIAMVALSIASFLTFDAPMQQPTGDYSSTPFFSGFLNGYLTMDAIAGLAFGIIVVTALKERGVTDRKTTIKQTIKAGSVTAIGLIVVYGSIGWMGAKMASMGSYNNGGEILADGANILFGSFGGLLLGTIVALACFTTCIGLTVACSQFFSNTFKSVKYTHVAIVFTLISFGFTNMGLSQIIAYSVPALVFIYPLAIVLIALSFFHRLFNGSKHVYRGALILTSVIAIYDGLKAFLGAEKVKAFTNALDFLPLFAEGLGWVVPAAVGALIGGIIEIFAVSAKKKRNVTIQDASYKASS